MTTSLKERLAKQREAVAATGAGADDVIRQRVVPLEVAKPVEVTPPASVAHEAEATNAVEVMNPAEPATSPNITNIPSPITADSSPIAATASPITADASPIAATASPITADASPIAATASPIAATASPIAATASPIAARTNLIAEIAGATVQSPAAAAPDPTAPSATTSAAYTSTIFTPPSPTPSPAAAIMAPALDDTPEVEATRTQGIPISASDDAIITAMEAHCRRHRIKVRRNSNVSLITRAGWRLLYDLMQRDPQAFAAAIEAGRPPRRPAN